MKFVIRNIKVPLRTVISPSLLLLMIFGLFYGISSSLSLGPFRQYLLEEEPWITIFIWYISLFVLSFLLISILSKKSYQTYGFRKPEKWMPKFLFIATLLLIFGNIVPLAIRLYMGENIPKESIFICHNDSALSRIFNIILISLFIPLTEETTFRGLFQTYLMRRTEGYIDIAKWRIHTGTIITIIFYVLFHLINIFPPVSLEWESLLRLLIFVIVLGTILSYLYQETKSLYPSMLFHSIINTSLYISGYIIVTFFY